MPNGSTNPTDFKFYKGTRNSTIFASNSNLITSLLFVCLGVVPDDDMGYKLIRIFGQESHAFRKYQRMMYWMPKFKFANPYYVPYQLPTDDIELAKMALKRMAVDLENKLTVHHVSGMMLFDY